jgi:16S rRNA (cytosine967-C5)-methyltransferase
VTDALAAAAPAIVQDPAANLVSLYADVPSGTMVADFCAAPGGKVLALPAPRLRILAADRSESRIHVLKENALRVDRPVALAVADALHPPVKAMDVVLLDVPCTGTGTLARHPDARWRLRPGAIDEMAALQGRMLDAAADVVRPGGILVYSTCTLEHEENAACVASFLERRADYSVDASDAVPEEYRTKEGFLEVTPQAQGFDGAFGARLRRAS